MADGGGIRGTPLPRKNEFPIQGEEQGWAELGLVGRAHVYSTQV